MTPAQRLILLGTRFQVLERQARAAAKRNNAALGYALPAQLLAGNVYQDAAATTPASGTDPIGYYRDRGNGSYPAIQATAGAKPALSLQSNGYYGIALDGTTDTLEVPAGLFTSTTSCTLMVTAKMTSVAAGGALAAMRAGTPILGYLFVNADGSVGAIVRDDFTTLRSIASAAGAVTNNTPFTAELTKQDGATGVELFVNGVSQATAANVGTTTGGYARIGSYSTDGSNLLSPFGGSILLYCMAPNAIPAADRATIRALGNFLAGV